MRAAGWIVCAMVSGISSPGPAQQQNPIRATNAAILAAVRASGTTCDVPDDARMSYAPPSVEWRRDVNGDGRAEALVTEGGTYCYGNTGTAFWLLSPKPTGGWTIVAHQTGIANLLAVKGPGGWPDLEVAGPGLCFPVLRWAGTAYRAHRMAYDGKPCGEPDAVAAPARAMSAPAAVPVRRGRAATRRRRPVPPPPVAPPPPPRIVLAPFDIQLANAGEPLAGGAVWSGIGLFSSVLNAVTLQVANAGGKLSGIATVRPVTSAQPAELKVEGRIKADACQIKIETLGTFKGRCSAAGFTGNKGFLGTFDGALLVYAGGANAMARAGGALPRRVGFGGKATSIGGGFSMDQFFLLNQVGGVLLGTARDMFAERGVAGAAFDATCVLLTTGGARYEGECGTDGWRGMAYAGGKPSSTLSLAMLSDQQVAAGIAAQDDRSRAALALVQPTRSPPTMAAATDAPSAVPEDGSGSTGPTGQGGRTVTATGRPRYLVEPGGQCGPETMLLKGYCFGEAIALLEREPTRRDLTVIAARRPVELGARIGRGEYLYVQVKRRQEGGYYADKDLRGYAKVPIPQRCIYGGVANEGFVINLAEGRKAAIEVADYVCG